MARINGIGEEWEPPRGVVFFVSSTFRDMQRERDALREVVVPRLRAFAARYGTTIDLLDLRWGIDTSEVDERDHNRVVLRFCRQAIRDCEPFFLSLLGDRYGAPMGDADGDGDAEICSATEWEIREGLFAHDAHDGQGAGGASDGGPSAADRNGTMAVCLVRRIANREQLTGGLRDTFVSTGADALRLDRLRRRVVQRDPDGIARYSVSIRPDGSYDLREFCDLVTRRIETMLRGRWGNPPREGAADAVAVELATHRRRAADRARAFTAREREISQVLDFAKGDAAQGGEDPDAAPARGSGRFLLVEGPSGSGKTTLMCAAVRRLAASDGDDAGEPSAVACVLCGSSPMSSSTEGVLRMLVHWLGGDVSVTDDAATLRERFAELLAARCAHGPVALFLDALDRIVDAHGSLAWLIGEIPKGCHVVASSLPGLFAADATRRNGKVIGMPSLGDAETEAIAANLALRRGRILPGRVRAALRDRARTAGGEATPLLVALMVEYLLMIDEPLFRTADRKAAHGERDAYVKLLLDRLAGIAAFDGPADGVPMGGAMDAGTAVFEAIVADAERIVGPCVRPVLAMIAASRFGLRVDDLKVACDWCDYHRSTLPAVAASEDGEGRPPEPVRIGADAAHILWFAHLVPDLLVRNDQGAWDFSHQFLRGVFRSGRSGDVAFVNLHGLVPYLKGKVRNGADLFVCREIMHHLRLAGDAEAAMDLLVRPPTDAMAMFLDRGPALPDHAADVPEAGDSDDGQAPAASPSAGDADHGDGAWHPYDSLGGVRERLIHDGFGVILRESMIGDDPERSFAAAIVREGARLSPAERFRMMVSCLDVAALTAMGIKANLFEQSKLGRYVYRTLIDQFAQDDARIADGSGTAGTGKTASDAGRGTADAFRHDDPAAPAGGVDAAEIAAIKPFAMMQLYVCLVRSYAGPGEGDIEGRRERRIRYMRQALQWYERADADAFNRWIDIPHAAPWRGAVSAESFAGPLLQTQIDVCDDDLRDTTAALGAARAFLANRERLHKEHPTPGSLHDIGVAFGRLVPLLDRIGEPGDSGRTLAQWETYTRMDLPWKPGRQDAAFRMQYRFTALQSAQRRGDGDGVCAHGAALLDLVLNHYRDADARELSDIPQWLVYVMHACNALAAYGRGVRIVIGRLPRLDAFNRQLTSVAFPGMPRLNRRYWQDWETYKVDLLSKAHAGTEADDAKADAQADAAPAAGGGRARAEINADAIAKVAALLDTATDILEVNRCDEAEDALLQAAKVINGMDTTDDAGKADQLFQRIQVRRRLAALYRVMEDTATRAAAHAASAEDAKGADGGTASAGAVASGEGTGAAADFDAADVIGIGGEDSAAGGRANASTDGVHADGNSLATDGSAQTGPEAEPAADDPADHAEDAYYAYANLIEAWDEYDVFLHWLETTRGGRIAALGAQTMGAHHCTDLTAAGRYAFARADMLAPRLEQDADTVRAEGRAWLEQAGRIAASTGTDYDSDASMLAMATALNGLGQAYDAMGDPGEANAWYGRARKTLDSPLIVGAPQTLAGKADLLWHMARRYIDHGRRNDGLIADLILAADALAASLEDGTDGVAKDFTGIQLATRCYFAAGQYLIDTQRWRRAITVYAKARRSLRRWRPVPEREDNIITCLERIIMADNELGRFAHARETQLGIDELRKR